MRAGVIQCRYASLAELRLDQPGVLAHWLSQAERNRYSQIRSTERKQTFLAGRIVAKRLLMQTLPGINTNETEIVSRDGATGRGTRPVVLVGGREILCSLSIAHTSRGVLAAVCTDAAVGVGVDLVLPIHGIRGLGWTITMEERRWLAATPIHLWTAERLWAIKESLFKAGHEGASFAPQQIETTMANPLVLQAWHVDGQIAALAAIEHKQIEGHGLAAVA